MIPEYITHKKIAEGLKTLGWRECPRYKEHELIEDYLLKDILTQKLKEINNQEFKTRGFEEEDITNVVENAINKLLSTHDPVQIRHRQTPA